MLATAIKKKEQEWFKEGLTLGEERGRIEGRTEGMPWAKKRVV